MHKVGTILLLIMFPLLLISCSKKISSTVKSQKNVDNYVIYQVKTNKISVDQNHNWKISGTTKAPDGAKVVATPYSINNENYGMLSSESEAGANWSKVQDGKFVVVVDPVGLANTTSPKTGYQTKTSIFAIKGYSKPWTTPSISTKIVKKASSFGYVNLKVNSETATYIANLNSKNSSSPSNKPSSSSSSIKSLGQQFESKMNSLNGGTAEYATYNQSTNTVTWIGFSTWNSYSDSDLHKMMDILQTITYRQATKFNIQNPNIVVKTDNGTLIANASNGSDLHFAK
jgi:hypothetical protein